MAKPELQFSGDGEDGVSNHGGLPENPVGPSGRLNSLECQVSRYVFSDSMDIE